MISVVKNIFLNRKFINFLLASGIAALVNFSSRILLGIWLSYTASIVVAYIFGIITAYILCKRFIFTSSNNNKYQEVLYFTIVNLFAILITVLVSVAIKGFLVRFTTISGFLCEEIAHFIGICAPAFTSYLGHKYLSFR